MGQIKTLQNQVIALVAMKEDVKTRLEEAALQLYGVRLQADAESYHRATLDTVRNTLDNCVKLLS